ncbi:MAG: hypothetical protein V3U87_09245 [Methylococcaceae bacterium]
MNKYISQLEVQGNELSFYSPIKKILIVNEKILVLLQRVSISIDENKESFTQNLHAFSLTGRKLWTIEEPKSLEGSSALITGVYSKKNKVLVYISSGIEYEVNLKNGKLLHISNQRPW